MRRRLWTFTGAPLWRDWVAGIGSIGIGFAVYSPGDRTAAVINLVLYCLGGLILLAAVAHAIRASLNKKREGCD